MRRLAAGYRIRDTKHATMLMSMKNQIIFIDRTSNGPISERRPAAGSRTNLLCSRKS